ncbi:PREDICTED: uncharacterized protein LOC104822652 [Tarenaya hassleriana]|uniref:uncharacterized protein LOC104822652 n=1 Tax=Tarenaya hassleriana TaxID=28532 RepID=UPI00053C5220|nr:PREDICTED: uncharacterized protein LOC104822652 [Tarenaya hassleriana]
MEVGNRQEPNNSNNAHPVNEEGGKWELSKYLEHQGEWLERARGNLMVVATVLATISFQVAINPPGGVWQQDDGCGPTGDNCTRIAGTSVLENSKFGSKDAIFHDLLTNCIVSFTFSMATIYFLLLGVSLRSKLVAFLIFSMMGSAVGVTVQAFKLSVRLVHSDNSSIRSRMLIYDWFWLVSTACYTAQCPALEKGRTAARDLPASHPRPLLEIF